MSRKRKNTSSPECESSSRRWQSADSLADDGDTSSDAFEDRDRDEYDEKPQISSTTGQSGAFPGLAGTQSDELFYGPAEDGIDYLRMVRSEARGIPGLLKAHADNVDSGHDFAEDDETSLESNIGGFWQDDAFIALPLNDDTLQETLIPPAQKKYHESIVTLFHINRTMLKLAPPINVVSNLSNAQPITFPADNAKARAIWVNLLQTSYPNPAQVACMDNDSVMELLRLLEKKIQDGSGSEKEGDCIDVRRTGAWVWAALGKCPGRDVLGAEEVGDLRNLAKTSVNILRSLRPPQIHENQTDTGESWQDDNERHEDVCQDDELTSSIDAARSRLERQDSDNEVNPSELEDGARDETDLKLTLELSTNKYSSISRTNTYTAMLEIIVTIVGEVYGQRDLLELRPLWPDQMA